MQPARSRILFVCLLQSLALVLLLVGARHGWLPLYLALPLGVVLLWLPWTPTFRSRFAPSTSRS
ncbi:hypothetical protein HKW75_19000 [Pseudomonas aeruginosa]|nr:hypothetical protein [Pseudomonas aeruginosa]